MSKESYVGKRILITGGAGYLATAVVKNLGDIDCQIIRLDRPGVWFPEAVGVARVENISSDICRCDVWSDLLTGIDLVFHLAGQTSANLAFNDPVLDLQTNMLPMLHLLQTIRREELTIDVVFAGTATECGITADVPVDESQADQPITIYDLHKWGAEQYVKQYVRAGFVRGSVLRLANVYGPGPKSSSADRGVLNGMIRKALNGEPLTIWGLGEYTRDYIFVDDVARAFLAAGATMEQVNGRHFVIGSGVGWTIADAVQLVANRVAHKTGSSVQVVHVSPPDTLLPIEQRHFVANTAAFTTATGWRPTMSLKEGVDLTISAIQAEPCGS